jgi:hypothetical protein
MLPSDLTDFSAYPDVETFVKTRLTPHYADARGMLQQPGYNFISATCLCGIVSGISVTIYKPAATKKWAVVKGVRKKVPLGTGDLFKMLLERFYPWDTGENGKDKAKVVYDLVRNPLAHALGEDKQPGYTIRIRKCKEHPPMSGVHVGLSDTELTAIEGSATRPADLKLAVDGSGKVWDLRVESFYWGVFHLLCRLAADSAQMTDAQRRFAAGKIMWHK